MRKIIHVDMDCFYAAIEQRDDPSLKGMPVAVGGNPHSRGVIATCNYEARRFGVHSAMPSAHAARLCPDLVFVRPNLNKYKEESKKIRQIFHQYTELVEPLSLDEAYLDTTESTHYHNSATWIAQAICYEIYQQTQLTASAGVARSKFLAKIASDWNKPAGLKVILPEEETYFIEKLPVKKLHGVGKVMARKLESMDIFTCGELKKVELGVLLDKFGKTGKYLYDLCRGEDKRTVKPHSDRKSLSVENTFNENISEWSECEAKLIELISDLTRRLQKIDKAEKINKVYVKVKMADFQIRSAESISQGLDVSLITALFKRLRKNFPEPIRLLGIGVKFPQTPKSKLEQLDIPF
ncbi:DNA polymerase IV [Aliikangiella sp. G2MR2-5]|uniref:DNA polymerase IV n=1 Tax=Aliikangiella sp. G2MR2-5 TaxID=2788943 RepID=UPI0018A9BF51|nr:DNA polymerase IV [Aliikangiella sp. G2MR2-5]